MIKQKPKSKLVPALVAGFAILASPILVGGVIVATSGPHNSTFAPESSAAYTQHVEQPNDQPTPNADAAEQSELANALGSAMVKQVEVNGKTVRFYIDGHAYIDTFSKYQQAQVYDAANSAWKRIYNEHHTDVADSTVYASLYDSNTDHLLWRP